MEIEILKSLNFDLGRPLSLHFLRRNSKAGDVSAEQHNFAKFVLEVSFTDYSLAHLDPSKLAAASLLLVLRVMDGNLFCTITKYHPGCLQGGMVSKVGVKTLKHKYGYLRLVDINDKHEC